MSNYTKFAIPPGWDRWYAWNGANEGWKHLNDQGRGSLSMWGATSVPGVFPKRFANISP